METSMIYSRKKMPPPCPADIPPFSQVNSGADIDSECENGGNEGGLSEMGLRTCAATERSVEALSDSGMKKWKEI